MKHIESMISKIKLIDSSAGLNQFLAELQQIFNYSWAGLAVFQPVNGGQYKPRFYGPIPPSVVHFIDNDEHIKRHCLNENQPVSYQELANRENHDVFVEEHIELIIPINGIGSEFCALILSIPVTTASPQVLEKVGWYWLMLAPFIYSQYRKHVADTKNGMTKRELECIKWAAEGKTSWEISQLLSISQRTVDFHLANCITKTESINRQQAIVKCVLNGQIMAI